MTHTTEIQQKSKSELKELLEAELGTEYPREITDSLRNDFLRACYTRIAPKEDPAERARSHPDYSESWREKRTLATALRMLLAARGVREPDTPLTTLDKAALAQIIVAIRLVDTDQHQGLEASVEREPPERTIPPEPCFDERLHLNSDATESEVESWIDAHHSGIELVHSVYVLDCTPPINEESNSLESLRARVAEKERTGDIFIKMEEAAAAVTRGERIYYVGYTNNVIDRVTRHVGGASYGSAKFTHTFRPQALVEVNWYDTEAVARNRERQRAQELIRPGKSYGYWE